MDMHRRARQRATQIRGVPPPGPRTSQESAGRHYCKLPPSTGADCFGLVRFVPEGLGSPCHLDRPAVVGQSA
eukprot:3325557-Alexandrium_andersonii.AAC.1